MPLKFPKDAGYRTDRAQKASRSRRLRPATRYAAWQQDQQRCVFPSCRRWVEFADAHIHEVQFRSLQGDECDLDNAVTTCSECHADLHVRVGGKRKRIEGSRSAGLRFYMRHSWREAWKEVL